VRIAVFGATGGTGRSLVEQALERGHEVVALARRPGALGVDAERLTVVEGDALDRGAVARVVEGADAVACALGLPKGEGTTVSEGTRNICEAMRAAGVERLVVVSVMGLRDSRDHAGLFGKVVIPLFLKRRMEDRVRQEEVVEESGLDFCLVRSARLVDGPRTGSYSAGPGVRAGMTSKVSRADVAHFVLEQAQNGDVHRGAASIVGG
jgi:putative NADH-flavin reductase